MSKLVTLFGGSGFVGRYVARRMAKAGWRVRVAVRRPNEALFVKPYGVVGQVEPVLCNIRDEASVTAAIAGADAVVNCVGVLTDSGANGFDAVHVDGAERVARLAAAQGVSKLVHLSAIGADPDAASLYAQSKGAGEAAVLAAMPNAVILRPSVIFGPEDTFFNRFAQMTRSGPVLPIVGGQTKFQPVYVDDVAEAVEKSLLGDVTGVFELGGPDARAFRDLMDDMLQIIRRRRLVFDMPKWAARFMASGLNLAETLSLGLFSNTVLTKDQIVALGQDNVVSEDAKGFADLGIAPLAMDAVLPDYLWRFRPSGQYEEIKESARDLKA